MTEANTPGANTQKITIDNLLRAESDVMFRQTMATYGLGIGEILHVREMASADAPQPVIRPNQDTLYSIAIVDLTEPVTVTLPEAGVRFQSMLVISQDHYSFGEASPGSYTLTREDVGTRFAMILFRTFADAGDEDDMAAAHEAQDGIEVSGGGAGPLETPDWDLEALAAARKAVNDLAASVGFDARKSFGRKDEVAPVDHLVGGIAGWAGQPVAIASAIVDSVEVDDGRTPYAVTVRDVPVDAFWSITVYNENGYLEPNPLGRNSYNNHTAQPNEDGSITIHFGGCEDGRVNCIPITPGWNYTVRMYLPHQEIIDGRWTFPKPRTLT